MGGYKNVCISCNSNKRRNKKKKPWLKLNCEDRNLHLLNSDAPILCKVKAYTHYEGRVTAQSLLQNYSFKLISETNMR